RGRRAATPRRFDPNEFAPRRCREILARRGRNRKAPAEPQAQAHRRAVGARRFEWQAAVATRGAERQAVHEPEIESGVGDHVDERGTGGKNAVLDAKMRRVPFIETDKRAVPAPDHAIVQAQMAQLLGGILESDRQQRAVVAEIFLEELETGALNIARTQRDARGTGNDHSLLEERDARLLPERLAEEKGRVAAG